MIDAGVSVGPARAFPRHALPMPPPSFAPPGGGTERVLESSGPSQKRYRWAGRGCSPGTLLIRPLFSLPLALFGPPLSFSPNPLQIVPFPDSHFPSPPPPRRRNCRWQNCYVLNFVCWAGRRGHAAHAQMCPPSTRPHPRATPPSPSIARCGVGRDFRAHQAKDFCSSV